MSITSQNYLIHWQSHADYRAAWDYINADLGIENYVKIYSSQNFEMQLLAVFFDLGPIEKLLHEALESKRVQEGPGQEWFRGTFDEIVSAVVATARQNGHDVQNYFSCVPVEPPLSASSHTRNG